MCWLGGHLSQTVYKKERLKFYFRHKYYLFNLVLERLLGYWFILRIKILL